MAVKDDLLKHARERISLHQQSIDALSVVANGKLPDDPERARIEEHIRQLKTAMDGDHRLITEIGWGLAGGT